MSKVNCIICGEEYEVCRACPATTRNTPWRKLCDTPIHYQVYLLIQDIRANTLTKSEAKETLARIGVTKNDVFQYLPSVQNILLPLFEEEKLQIKKKTKKVTTEDVHEPSELIEK